MHIVRPPDGYDVRGWIDAQVGCGHLNGRAYWNVRRTGELAAAKNEFERSVDKTGVGGNGDAHGRARRQCRGAEHGCARVVLYGSYLLSCALLAVIACCGECLHTPALEVCRRGDLIGGAAAHGDIGQRYRGCVGKGRSVLVDDDRVGCTRRCGVGEVEIARAARVGVEVGEGDRCRASCETRIECRHGSDVYVHIAAACHIACAHDRFCDVIRSSGRGSVSAARAHR